MGIISHRFFCLNCGKENIPIYRNPGHLHKKNHRKVLYCPWCKTKVNHIECSNEFEVTQFREDFKEGVYKDEAQESVSYGRSAR
jgi:transcription elongation factor Elf1